MAQTTVAAELARMIAASGRTQREIAHDAGYERPNVISMMKKGVTRVPIGMAPALARACGADPKAFLRLVLEEYHPSWWGTLRDAFGEILTEEERALLERFRAAAMVSAAPRPEDA